MNLRSISVFCVLVISCAGHSLAGEKPLQVYILVGQSNMQGHAHVRTLEHLAMSPESRPWLDKILTKQGTPRVHEGVWISYLSASGVRHGQLTTGFGADENKIGPELMFGITMKEKVGEPILLIKAAWGGKSLHTDFRPPGSGKSQFHPDQLKRFEEQGKDVKKLQAERAEASGHYYRETMQHVRNVLANIKDVYPDYDAERGYEIRGIVWFQGWNDMVDGGAYPERGQPGGYDQYSEVMAQFIRDVRKDLGKPNLPFVIGVLGVGGPTSEYGPKQMRYQTVHQNFRDAMAAPASLPEFQGNVAAVRTEKFWDLELTALRSKENDVRSQVRKMQEEQNLSRQEAAALQEKRMAEAFTERELEIMQKGVSNGEYHYLGSAKIMAGIGQGLADAMVELQEK